MTLVEFQPVRGTVESPLQEREAPAVLEIPEEVVQTVQLFQAAYAEGGAEGLVTAWQDRIDADVDRTLDEAHTPLD